MCHFLTIAVPEKTVPEVPGKFRQKIHFTAHRNRSVTEHAPADWTSFTATSEGCSCDFYRASDDSSDHRSKLAKKYRKKGWSETKIQRALENLKVAPTRTAGLRDDIVDLTTELAHAFGQVRLSLHWYSGDIETEKFVLRDAGQVTLQDFRAGTTALRDETTITIKGEQLVAVNRLPAAG